MDTEEKQYKLKKNALILDGTKFLLGTLLLGFITIYLPRIVESSKIQTQKTQERDFICEFIKYALVEDIETRLRFSHYFSKVTTNPEQRAMWAAYHTELKENNEKNKTKSTELLSKKANAANFASGMKLNEIDKKLEEIEVQSLPLEN